MLIHHISLFKDYKDKIFRDYKELGQKIEALKQLGLKIVCTVGSWDMLHVGHDRYLLKAKKFGDILVVGVDSDRGIKNYKGYNRPIAPEEERIEMITYQGFVDFVTVVDDINENGVWQLGLIKKIPVDIFVAVEDDSYSRKQLEEIKKYCDDLKVIPRQAKKVSSSILIQRILKQHPILDDLMTTLNKYRKEQ